MEKRRDTRVHKLMRVQLTHEREPINGSTIDISPYGMRIRLHLRKVLSPAQMIDLKVVDHGKTYPMDGLVRWYKRDVVDNSRYVGISFESLNPDFCEDILKLNLGGTNLPYRCSYHSKEDFFKEYLENIIYGGLLMKTSAPPPDLYRKVYVELVVPEKEDSLKVEGEVVAHVPGGFGLKLNNMTACKRRLNDWMGDRSAMAI